MSRPRAASHGIVDDRDRRSIPPIPRRKEAASQQRRPDGFEEIRADLVSYELQALGHRCVISFDRDDLFPTVRNEQIADDAGTLHTRNRLNRFEHAVVKVGALRGNAESRRSREFHHKDPLRPESRIDAVHVPPAADEQAGACEQDDRQRKIRHHERAADSTGRRSAGDTSATLLARGTQVTAQRRYRGRQSHQNSRHQRDGQGPTQDAGIETYFIQTRQVAGAEGADEANPGEGEECADQSRDSRKQDAFGQQLSHDPSSTRSQRSADSHLTRAGDATGQ